MTDTAYRPPASAPAEGGRPLFRIHRERDRRALNAALSGDRVYAAYALGHLESPLFERSHFWVAEGEHGSAVVLHATAIGRTLFVAGDPAAAEAVLSLHPGPRSTYLSTCAPEHLPVLERTHALSDTLRMMRMSVTKAAFAAVDGAVRRLRGTDARRLNALYALEDGPNFYTGDHVERGVYYGAFDGEELTSVAGTHIVAPQQSVAVVGNVFTHPAHRGGGLATRVTSRVTADLLDSGCALVVLTVNPTNTPAVPAYARLGYERGMPVVEARVQRRDRLGLGAWLRRRVARRRAGGRGDGSDPGAQQDVSQEVWQEVAPGRPAPASTEDGWADTGEEAND